MEFLLCFVLGFGGGYLYSKKDMRVIRDTRTQEEIRDLRLEQGSFPEDFNPD